MGCAWGPSTHSGHSFLLTSGPAEHFNTPRDERDQADDQYSQRWHGRVLLEGGDLPEDSPVVAARLELTVFPCGGHSAGSAESLTETLLMMTKDPSPPLWTALRNRPRLQWTSDEAPHVTDGTPSVYDDRGPLYQAPSIARRATQPGVSRQLSARAERTNCSDHPATARAHAGRRGSSPLPSRRRLGWRWSCAGSGIQA
jgi:hypothetical protein